MKVVVVGAGVAGLSAAHRILELDPSADVTVLEASSQPCGMLVSERTDDGFVIERGPDSILTSKPAALSLAKRLGIESRVVRTNETTRGAYVVHRGRLERAPEGFNVVAPSDVWGLLRSPILSWPGKARAGLDLVLPKGAPKDDESLASFVTRRFGPELLERLAQPMAGGIYGAPPRRLSLRATMPRFLDVEQSSRSVTLGLMKQVREGAEKATGARYGLFVSFDRGVAVLPETLAEKLGERVRLRTPARAIEREGRSWIVRTDDARFDADALILAIPARIAAPLLAPIDRELEAHLCAIPFGSAATATFAWRREDVPHPLDASGFVVPAIEGRLLLAATWASVKWPGRAPEGKVLIRTFLGGNDRDECVRFSDEELLTEGRRGLADLMGITAPPLFHRVDRYVDAMPRYEVGHLRRQDRVDALLARHGRLALAGSSYRGVGIPDSIANAESAAERLLA